MFRTVPLLVVITLLVLVSVGMADPPDTMDAVRWKQALEAVSLETISDTTPIWTDPLPDSTIIALRLALYNLGQPITVPISAKATYAVTRQQAIATIRRILRTWEKRMNRAVTP